ncbi:hypothetical protein H6F90_03915 [Trichocoleus sp. FACHB-591]|uniref:hypothetical protein n=1 Tax=Trichocoleus sp. FACHB-591 TaxID=2692872 RepID=UPI00168906D6|nr:hypothetical protein [Trichocoleus sp. FACHB-591]MBD2094294.1 hypothetical protein [Trichocoleus sp. FACHB-591]
MLSDTSATKSFHEQQKVFLAQFIKGGVEYSLALQAAEILAAEKPEELLTDTEKGLVNEACRLWLSHRNGMNKIKHAIACISINLGF